MQIQFTKQAREELLRIVSVFAEFAGARSANLFVERVRERGATLLKHPEIGHPETLLSDRKRIYRSISINKNYYIHSGTDPIVYLGCYNHEHLNSQTLSREGREFIVYISCGPCR